MDMPTGFWGAAAFAHGGGSVRLDETAAFGANPGGLRMLSYVPEGLPRSAPLVVLLHGCGQSAEAFAINGGWLTLADRLGFAVLAPEQAAGNNLNRCFNWFRPQDVVRGGGEAGSIAAMIAFAVHAHSLDPKRVFVSGLSAGGAMASTMLAVYPELFAGGAIIAGLPYGAAGSVQDAMRAMHGVAAANPADLAVLVRGAARPGARIPRISIWHGDADHVVSPVNAVQIAGQWSAAHGLSRTPDQTRTLKGRVQAVWRSPKTGEVMIESNLVHGLGHGVPLSTRAPGDVGAPAPYMLEAGVSSTLETARFWGLADAPAAAKPRPKTAPAPEIRVPPAPPPAADEIRPAAPPAFGVVDQIMGSLAGRVPAGVRDVIAKALKTAGLKS